MNKNDILKITLGGFIMLAAVSCGETEKFIPEDTEKSTLAISAVIDNSTSTRGYQEEGEITEGIYYLTYPGLPGSESSETEYITTDVNFIKGTGIAMSLTGKELQWGDIGYNSSAGTLTTLYLDNFSSDNTGETLVNLPSDTPYKASILDKVSGSNDLLWGKLSKETRDDRNLPFQLHHCMSRIRVKIIVDNSGTAENLDLKNATVEISELIHNAQSYDRLTGNLNLGENPDYSVLKLIENENDWEVCGNSLDNQQIEYITRDFVLPPQELKKDSSRPQLTITVPVPGKEPKIYDAVLPNAMTVTENGENIPMTLSFMRELYLTLTVRIDTEDLKITFMPVTVVDWVDHGRVSVSGTQAGIYTSDDFYSLIKAYGEKDKNSLLHYGYQKDGGDWIFNIFIDGIFLNLEEISGKMKGDDYSFDFHNHSVTVINGDNSIILDGKHNGEEELCEILKEGNL